MQMKEPVNETYKDAYMRCATLEALEWMAAMDLARAKYYEAVDSLDEIAQALIYVFNKKWNKGDQSIMFSDFRQAFNPTKEEIKRRNTVINYTIREMLERYKQIECLCEEE